MPIDPIAWTSLLSSKLESHGLARRVEAHRGFIRDVSPLIKMKSKLRALSPSIYAITQYGEFVTSGPQLSDEAKAQDAMIDELIERIKLSYERDMVICSVDLARHGSEETVAYRVEYREGRQQIEPISAEEMYGLPLSINPLFPGLTPSKIEMPHVPSCRQCGQATEHFFTSQRDQSVLCEACFGERETKRLAKEVQGSVDGHAAEYKAPVTGCVEHRGPYGRELPVVGVVTDLPEASRNQARPLHSKSKHPLDAWMG